MTVPVFRPALPPAEALLPYLREIDASRYYTNRGPLAERLEARLAALFGLPAHAVRSASTGTAAIELALLAHAGPARPARPLALLPSFTFAATAHAAERCGYRVHLLDIDPESWALDPARLLGHPLVAQAGAVLPVAPFGRRPNLPGWEGFQAETGVPVVIDAAAAFEAVAADPGLVSARLPLCLSFHATKSFSTGEGGAVLWADEAGQDRVVTAGNFGFWGSREAQGPATNAKLSEYHAAVGLAMLDDLPARRAAWAAVHAAWARAARGRALPGRLHLAPELASAYVLIETRAAAAAAAAAARLAAGGVETRLWYGRGLAPQPHFAAAPRDPLPATEDLAPRLLGLPMAHDLAPATVAAVIDLLAQAAAPARAAAG
jgi:dTDP-4-amino-4,6-dideoxygalactose transaminase